MAAVNVPLLYATDKELYRAAGAVVRIGKTIYLISLFLLLSSPEFTSHRSIDSALVWIWNYGWHYHSDWRKWFTWGPRNCSKRIPISPPSSLSGTPPNLIPVPRLYAKSSHDTQMQRPPSTKSILQIYHLSMSSRPKSLLLSQPASIRLCNPLFVMQRIRTSLQVQKLR